ncbi:MAG: DUF11 domain-containing protein, partial [Actinomycetota bacterium]|nr:DUF11 domain-containing protein [Actinomycetota bacterium]
MVAVGQHVTCQVVNDDIAPTITVHKDVVNNDGGSAIEEDFILTVNGGPVGHGAANDVKANEPSVISEELVPGYAPSMVVCTSDMPDSPNTKTVTNTGTIDVTPALAENIDCIITNDDVAPGLTVVKAVINDDGGNEAITDFPLQVNGEIVPSGILIGYTADVALVITESQQPGYVASNITCTSSDAESDNNVNLDSPSGTLATVTLALGEVVVCTITNDDIAPTVTVHKTVVGGTKAAADFQMTVGGQQVPQDIPAPTNSNEPIEVSEVANNPDYELTSITCADLADGATLTNPLTLNEGQDAACTVTNTFRSPSITVVKTVTNRWGGQFGPADFKLKIDGEVVTQGDAHEVSAGAHTISELGRPGYENTSIVCIDLATEETVGEGGSINLVAGQEVRCTVANADMAAEITVVKTVINNDGGQAVEADFQMKIDNINVPQAVAQQLTAGNHTVTEDAVTGYRMVAIVCTDNSTEQTLVYNGGVNLALGQHATCRVTNDDDSVDLVITKSDDGLVKVAGGPAFDYRITVDNLGPFDALPSDPVTVTDELPAGLTFVSFPENCTAVGQTLTCDLDPADLQVADPPVVITVTVEADADAASDVYINMVSVDTRAEPACVGEGCVVEECEEGNNNVACEDTEITRQAGLTIVKVDNVDVAIHPGATFDYSVTVGNTGPSTLLPGLSFTDDVPVGLDLVSVAAASPWSCVTADPVVCTYNATLQPNTTAPVITITVHSDPTFLDVSHHNVAQAVGSVVPGTVVTATDDETTPIVRESDLSIDKSVSQATATSGATFDWFLTVTNHGPDTATNVVVSDTIPAQFQVLGITSSAGLSCTFSGNNVSCTTATLASGAVASISVQVSVLASAAAGVVTNTATVATDASDTNPADNTDSASITIAPAVASSPPTPAPAPTPDVGSSAGGVTLPRTGTGSLAGPLTLAGLLLGGGIISLSIARRRRA